MENDGGEESKAWILHREEVHVSQTAHTFEERMRIYLLLLYSYALSGVVQMEVYQLVTF